MRIVNSETFLAMPANTVYSHMDKMDELLIKGDTCNGNHFFYQELSDSVDAYSSDVQSGILDDARDNGTSFDMDFHIQCRDGMFDMDVFYVVWERSDVEGLIDRLKECVKTPKRWWCVVHNREATHTQPNGKHACDPSLGGITLGCQVVPMGEESRRLQRDTGRAGLTMEETL